MREKILDATGLLCPLPVLKLRKHLKSMELGDIVLVLADDPAAAIDIPHFCNETGHTLISKEPGERLNAIQSQKIDRFFIFNYF